MHRLIRFSVNHPRLILAVVAIASLGASIYLPSVRLDMDARSLIPADSPSLAASDQAARRFGLDDKVIIGISNQKNGIFTTETLERIRRLTERLSSMKGIVEGSVVSLTTVPRLMSEEGELDTRPLLGNGYALDSREAVRIRRNAAALGLANGILISADEQAASVIAEVESNADRYLLLDQIRKIVSEESTGKDSIYLGGTALAQADLGISAAGDLAKLIPAVAIVLAAVLIFAFRNPLPVIISLAEISISLLWTIGLIGLSGQSVFITTLVLPVVIIAIGVSDDVYALKCYYDVRARSGSGSNREVIIESFSRASHSILLTAGTTAVGLLSLTVTLLEPSRVFGFYGAVAVGFSALFTLTLVPATLSLFRLNPPSPAALRQPPARERVPLALRLLTVASPRRVLAAFLLAAVCAGLVATRLRVDDSWVKNLPVSSDITKGDRFFNDAMAGSTVLEFQIDSGTGEGLLEPERLMILGAIEETVSALPSVGAVYSIYTDIVRATASLRQKSYAAFRDVLNQTGSTISRDEAEQSVMLLTSAQRAIGERIDHRHRFARLTVFVRGANYQRIKTVLETVSAASERLSKFGGGVVPFGDGWISYITVDSLVKGQVYSIALAMLIDMALLSLMLRSVQSALIAVAPVGFSLLVVFALLAIFDVPLGIANSMFTGVALGIGLDFSIHLTTVFRRGIARGLSRFDSMLRALLHAGPAIVTSAAAIAAGLSVLLFSEVAPNAQLGVMTAISLVICSIATLIVVPSLVLTRKA